MILADASTLVVLLVVAVIACLLVGFVVMLAVTLLNLAVIGCRELAYRLRRRKRAAMLYGSERRR